MCICTAYPCEPSLLLLVTRITALSNGVTRSTSQKSQFRISTPARPHVIQFPSRTRLPKSRGVILIELIDPVMFKGQRLMCCPSIWTRLLQNSADNVVNKAPQVPHAPFSSFQLDMPFRIQCTTRGNSAADFMRCITVLDYVEHSRKGTDAAVLTFCCIRFPNDLNLFFIINQRY